MATSEELAELRKIAARLSPSDKAAIFGPSGGADVPAHKMSPTLDALSDADAVRVVQACRAGIAHALKGGGKPEADAEALDMVAKVAPEAAAAMQRNSDHRRKPYVHSLQAASSYLQGEHARRKREERAAAAAFERSTPAAEPASTKSK